MARDPDFNQWGPSQALDAPANTASPLVGPGPVTSIPAGSSAAASGQIMDNGRPRATHGLVIIGSAGITAGAVRLDGSHDGNNWFQLIAPTNAVASAVTPANVSGVPCRYVRATISTAITGGTITATIASA